MKSGNNMECKLKHFALIMLIICFIVLPFFQIKLETQPMSSFFTNNITRFNRVAKFASIVRKIVNNSSAFESSKSINTATSPVKSTSMTLIVRTMNQLYTSTGKLVVFTTHFNQKKIGTKIPKYDIILNFKVLTGLGNRMFQYASALGIALSNNRNLKLYPVIPKMQANLNISSSWISNFSSSKYPKLSYEKCCLYYPESENLENKHVSLYGHLVSWKYFHQYKDIILNEFRFSPTILVKSKNFLSKIRSSNWNVTVIGVHVRRGDFITKAHRGFTVADKNYIERAVNYYQKKFTCVFVIATNGRDWTEQVFSSLPNTKYIFTGVTSPYTDMSIISSCDHVITTTGTFSWWIGYLSKGIVLYYKNFPRKGSLLKKTEFDNMDDYFFPEWIGL